MQFDDFSIAAPLLAGVADQGYATPTPIQEKAIPPALAGRDVLGCAQTGTGKTCAFALPILERLTRSASERRGNRRGAPRALIVAPTRELAGQILDDFKAYGGRLPIRHAAIFGGVSQFHQVRRLRAGVDVLIATPGRLLDLMEQGHVDLSAVETLVLDEADCMLDMGFIHDIRRIVRRVPEERQTLLFSATMPSSIRRLADSILRDPVQVQAAPESTTADKVSQSVYMVLKSQKGTLLGRLLSRPNTDRTLVFTRTKHGADRLVKVLRRNGVEAGAIHGNKTQGARTRALDAFKSGRTPVLVATDIASRGIDVDSVSHVVNFDMPNTPETYVHRIGRTARAGESGTAVSFCDVEEMGELRAVERLLGNRLEVALDEPDLSFEAATTPSPRKGGDRQNARGSGRGRAQGRGRSGPRASGGGRSRGAGGGGGRGRSRAGGRQRRR